MIIGIKGMYVDPPLRGAGLAAAFAATWLTLCLRSDAAPRTGVINKLLLALTLQRRFGFVPSGKGGVAVEVTAGRDGGSVLYPLSSRSLEGAFNDRKLRGQSVSIGGRAGACTSSSARRQSTVTVKTAMVQLTII